MGVELEKIFGPEVLEAFDARIRRIACETSVEGDEWLTVRHAAELSELSEWTVRQLARQGLLEKFQPNPGRLPLRIKKSSLLSLDKAAIERKV
jgi:predicted transcriptional regulator of viral defense system